MTALHNIQITLIGGSKRFGSGKVINELKKYMSNHTREFYFIETQGAKLKVISNIFKIPRSHQILFQPSICFPAFMRDLVIMFLIRILFRSISIIILVDTQFRNPLMKSTLIRKIFFNNMTVFSPAQPTGRVQKLEKISPYFDQELLQRAIVAHGSKQIGLVHLGYLQKLKGIDHYSQIVEQSKIDILNAFGIGDLNQSEHELISKRIVLIHAPKVTDIQNSILKLSEKFDLVYLFCSENDFAPLMVLEAGYWGVPIVVLRKTKAHAIVSSFLPHNCFIAISDINDLWDSRAEMKRSSSEMHAFIDGVIENKFTHQVCQVLEGKHI